MLFLHIGAKFETIKLKLADGKCKRRVTQRFVGPLSHVRTVVHLTGQLWITKKQEMIILPFPWI